MRSQSKQKLFEVELVMATNGTRKVKVKAASRKVAEDRAMKRVDGSVRVKDAVEV